jgi:prefoldin subunit 2
MSVATAAPPAVGDAPAAPPAVQYREIMSECQRLMQKIAELEVDRNEHVLVEETLKPLDPSRRAFRLVGEVLVERSVAEVLPSVTANKENVSLNAKTDGYFFTLRFALFIYFSSLDGHSLEEKRREEKHINSLTQFSLFFFANPRRLQLNNTIQLLRQRLTLRQKEGADLKAKYNLE